MAETLDEADAVVRFEVEALPDARRDRAIDKHHAKRLEKYGVKAGHSTLDVSDRLSDVAGHCMKLPSY